MRRAAAIIAALLLGATLGRPPAQAAGTPEDAARAVVEGLLAESHAAMTAEGLDEGARMARVEAAVSEAFAFDVWQRFLVGDRELTEAQRETFRALLPGFLAALYAERFGRGLAEAPEVTGTGVARRDILVEAVFPRAEGPPLPVTYRMREADDGGPRVIDIMVGGVSFLLLKRDEFGALIEKEGVEALLARMRERAGYDTTRSD